MTTQNNTLQEALHHELRTLAQASRNLQQIIGDAGELDHVHLNGKDFLHLFSTMAECVRHFDAVTADLGETASGSVPTELVDMLRNDAQGLAFRAAEIIGDQQP